MLTSILKKIRGAVGTAVTWAVAWGIGGFGLSAVLFAVSPRLGLSTFVDAAPMLTVLAGAAGFVGGTVFSAVLGTVHARSRLADLSPFRLALWGGLAGMLVPLGIVAGAAVVGGVSLTGEVLLATATVFGGLGVATAAGTVKLAQVGARELDGGGDHDLLGPARS